MLFQMQMQAAAPSADGFLPHGYCYLWNRPLLLTHLTSDVLIGLSYVVISVALAYLVHRARNDIPFSLVFIAFGLFIVTCGMTHFMEVYTLWHPAYWAAGGVKVVTALASVSTAAAMPFTVPAAVHTLKDARVSRERALAGARAAALQEQNDLLQQQAAELEQQTEVAERMAAELEEANEQLRAALAQAHEARRVAEAAAHAKSAFLATISHELRTPLNAIIGYEQLMEDGLAGPVTDTQRRQLRRIHSSATHLVGVVDEILTAARLEAGRESVKLEPVDAAQVARSAAAIVEPLAAEKGLRFEVRAQEDGTAITTDPTKLRQVLLNLLSNAVKFTENGEVSLRAGHDGDGWYTFEVRDTGIGISAEHLERVFEPFWQVDQTSTRRFGGSGLGLTVSRGLMGLLGGEIAGRSEPGAGSTFTIRVPIAPSLEAD